MDAAEFGEWLAFNRIEPIGSVHDDILAGWVTAHIAAAFGGGYKTWTDAIPRFDGEQDEDRVSEMNSEKAARAVMASRGMKFVNQKAK